MDPAASIRSGSTARGRRAEVRSSTDASAEVRDAAESIGSPRLGESLKASAVRAAAWGAMSSIVMRLGSLVVGIVLARLLTPEAFGIYAVALTVQGILMTVADLGLSSDLIRSKEPERIAPTIASIGLISGGTLTVLAMLTAPFLADVLGSPEASDAIAVLSLTLVLGSFSLVPYAMLMRRFQQRELFYVGAVDFTVSTVVTLTLVLCGFGVMALAIGRVVAQVVSSTLQFVLAKVRPSFGFDRSRLRPVLAFGLPIAGANLLAWGLGNVDNVILARLVGATLLGFYVLAFNVSSWPMNALAQSVRAIAMPYFSRADGAASGLAVVAAIGWAAALPAGGALAALSEPLITVLYGTKWLAAAPVLAALGTYGAFRVLFEVFNGFLYAQGKARPVLWIQILWVVVLIASMVPATLLYGIIGAGWVHAVVAGVVVLPAYLLALRAAGASLAAIARRSLWPTVSALPAVAAAWWGAHVVDEPVIALLVGAAASVGVWAATIWPWARREWKALRST